MRLEKRRKPREIPKQALVDLSFFAGAAGEAACFHIVMKNRTMGRSANRMDDGDNHSLTE
jgi:hypothetical protein